MRAFAIDLVGHTRRRTKLGGRACIDTQRSQVDEGIAWQGCFKGKDTLATVHWDDITIDGGRSAVEFLIKMMSRKYEIKKQVIGGDADLEKSGIILNRVIEWSRDGIPIEADQRRQGDTEGS